MRLPSNTCRGEGSRLPFKTFWIPPPVRWREIGLELPYVDGHGLVLLYMDRYCYMSMAKGLVLLHVDGLVLLHVDGLVLLHVDGLVLLYV
jgi:hypothetical protein